MIVFGMLASGYTFEDVTYIRRVNDPRKKIGITLIMVLGLC